MFSQYYFEKLYPYTFIGKEIVKYLNSSIDSLQSQKINTMEGFEFSRVEKKRGSPMSTGYDFSGQDETGSDYEICLGDEIDLEQDYITKLRVQRERMQKLEKGYSEKQQQLSKEMIRTNELLSEVERLTTFIPYKQKYEELKQDYTELLSKYNIQQNELEIVKQELAQVIEQNGNTISRLKSELKIWKENSVVNASQLEESLNDKEEEVRKLKRQWKDRQNQMLEEIKSLKGTVNKLKKELDSQSNLTDKERERMVYQLKSRDSTILDLEKALEHSRKTNLEMKNDISKFSQEVNSREHELSTMCTRLKHQISQNKKQLADKDGKLEEMQSEIKRLNLLAQDLKKENENIKIDYKKTCELYECGNKKLKYESDSEIGRLEVFIKELKESIQQLMEVKNHLLIENRKLVAILKKKQQTERQRKQLLRTEFKEIDRIEKVIDRLE